jgi:hypothetical protein
MRNWQGQLDPLNNTALRAALHRSWMLTERALGHLASVIGQLRVPMLGHEPTLYHSRRPHASHTMASVGPRTSVRIRSGFKADMQLVVSIRQFLDRPLDRQRTVLDIAEKSDFPGPTAFRDRHGVLLLGDIKSHKDFAMLSHGPPSVHEARLGLPEHPRS